MNDEPTTPLLEVTPGALQVAKSRNLPSGYLIEFEFSPSGWPRKDGTTRQKDHRAYYLTPNGKCAACDGSGRVPSRKRENGTIQCETCKGTGTPTRCRVPSVSSICDAILPKDGLPVWSERMGITGALEAFRRGLAHVGMTDEEIIQCVRNNGLGADRARDEAADRGLNVHALLEAFMLTGAAPNPAEHPEPHRPFIRALVRWLIYRQTHGGIEPKAVEMLVADPERGYAGRLDLVAETVHGLTLIDAKTQQDGCIYAAGHTQCRLYMEAEERFGEHRFDHGIIVVFDGHGGFREMELSASKDLVAHALDYYARVKPLAAGCDSQNRVVKQALREAA